MDMRGMPAGMTVFHVTIGGSGKTNQGWEFSISQRYPTFYVVGGNEADAVKNAKTVIGPDVFDKCDRVIITVQNASWDSEHAPHTETFTCE